MKQFFCYNCGNKMEYTHAPPNFCVKCGTSLKDGKTTASIPAPRAPQEEGDDDNLSDVDEVPQLNGIELEDNIPESQSNNLTLGNLFNNPTPSNCPKARNMGNLGNLIDEKRG
jgi:hypothetical protein